jgi:hypothetical protein
MKKALLSIFTIATFSLTTNAQIADLPVAASPTSILSGQNSTISTTGSQVGVDYILRNSSNATVDGPLPGNGGDLNFNTGSLTSGETFNVYATSTNSVGLEFDGSNDRVITSYIMPSTGGFTIEAWIYPTATSYKKIASNYNGTGGLLMGEITFDTHGGSSNNGRGLRTQIRGTGGIISYGVPDVLTLDAWNHVAVTYYAGVAALFVDGTMVGSTANSIGTVPALTYSFAIGEDRLSTGVSEYFLGKMGEVRIWDTLRTPAEIAANMTNCLLGNEVGLGAYYKFNDGTGSTATDEVGGGDATLTNMDTTTAWTVLDTALIPCGVNNDLEMTQTATVTVYAVGIDEQSTNDLKIYPNPATTQLTIDTDAYIEDITILDMFGAIVQKENSKTFSVENLAKGIYTITIETENGVYYNRLVKE